MTQTERKDGGPAFPRDNYEGDINEGMSLRDWFAAHAPAPSNDDVQLAYQIGRNRNPHNEAHKPKLRSRIEIMAGLAYRYADAMLAARKEQP